MHLRARSRKDHWTAPVISLPKEQTIPEQSPAPRMFSRYSRQKSRTRHQCSVSVDDRPSVAGSIRNIHKRLKSQGDAVLDDFNITHVLRDPLQFEPGHLPLKTSSNTSPRGPTWPVRMMSIRSTTTSFKIIDDIDEGRAGPDPCRSISARTLEMGTGDGYLNQQPGARPVAHEMHKPTHRLHHPLDDVVTSFEHEAAQSTTRGVPIFLDDPQHQWRKFSSSQSRQHFLTTQQQLVVTVVPVMESPSEPRARSRSATFPPLHSAIHAENRRKTAYLINKPLPLLPNEMSAQKAAIAQSPKKSYCSKSRSVCENTELLEPKPVKRSRTHRSARKKSVVIDFLWNVFRKEP